MKFLLPAAALAILFSSAARADFGFESSTEITGGALLKTALAAGFRQQAAATCLIKGNRMAIVTRNHTLVVNLENDTTLEIDFSEKTYQWGTFAPIRKKLDGALKGPAFQSAARSGGVKRIGILTAREQIVIMSREVPSLARIFLDYWTMTAPGFGEMRDFHERLAAKLGYAYAWGLAEIGMINPELLPGLEAAAKVLTDSQDLPVVSTIRLGAPGPGELAPPPETSDARSGMIRETLNHIGTRIGKLAHRRSGKEPPEDQDPALLGEVTIELGNFSAGPADQSKFNVPGGFKELKSPAPKP